MLPTLIAMTNLSVNIPVSLFLDGAVVSFQVTLEMPRNIAILLNGIFTYDLPKVCHLSSIKCHLPRIANSHGSAPHDFFTSLPFHFLPKMTHIECQGHANLILERKYHFQLPSDP